MIPLQFLYEVLLLLLLLLCVKDSPFSMHIVDCNIKTVLISKLNFVYFVKAWFSQVFQFDQNTNRRKKNWAHSLYIYTQNKPHVVEIRLCSKDRFYRIKLKYTCKLNFSFNLFFFVCSFRFFLFECSSGFVLTDAHLYWFGLSTVNIYSAVLYVCEFVRPFDFFDFQTNWWTKQE